MRRAFANLPTHNLLCRVQRMGIVEQMHLACDTVAEVELMLLLKLLQGSA